MKKPPKITIDKVDLIDSYYTDQDGNVYSAVKLIEQARGLPVFDLPLAGIDLRKLPWEIRNIDDFIYHVKRCIRTNLKHPVILDHYGTPADGYHRIVKAIVIGKRTIKAVRLETMPTIDRKEQ